MDVVHVKGRGRRQTFMTLPLMTFFLLLSCGADKADLPHIDPAKVAITLERSACFGDCPVYRVTVYGSGRVIFSTGFEPVDSVDAVHRQYARSHGVLLRGKHEDQIEPEAVAELVKQFEAGRFWHLKNEYRAGVTDSPTQTLTFDTGQRRKTVIDYVGREVGMPEVVTELELAVDRVAGTDRWVAGSSALIGWLERTQFDFRTAEGTKLAVAGEFGSAAETMVITLVDRGVPLDQPIAVAKGARSSRGSAILPGTSLVEASIKRGHAKLFKKLTTLGWLDRLGKNNAAQAFATDAAGCSPALVDAVADAGVEIDRDAAKNIDAYEGEPQGKTALAELASSYTCQDEPSRVETARRLLARGANPNHRDSLGRTPLYGVENFDLLNELLSHGADAAANSKDGQSMVFGSWTDAIVLRLLEAGASPVGRYDIDGNKTLAQQAKDRNMPKVAKWLADHPEAMKQ